MANEEWRGFAVAMSDDTESRPEAWRSVAGAGGGGMQEAEWLTEMAANLLKRNRLGWAGTGGGFVAVGRQRLG
jgi:hypothetical protein